MVLDVAAYNKDIVSDPAARLVSLYDPVQRRDNDFRILTNLDFGNVRGIDASHMSNCPRLSGSVRSSSSIGSPNRSAGFRGRQLFSHSSPAKPRMVVVVMSADEMRIPVSVSMRVRSSRAPSESRPYRRAGRSGSTLRRRISPT